MGSTFIDDFPGFGRFLGLNLREVAGHERRARSSGGFNGKVECFWGHHTASGPASDGWPSVNYGTFNADVAPIANWYIDRTGLIWHAASGATNTEGAGGPLFGLPKDGANARSVSCEVMNNGIGEPYTEAQQDSLLNLAGVFSFYCIQKGWWTLDELRSIRHGTHFEWAPTRKIDLRGPSRWNGGGAQVKWDYNAFRQAVWEVANHLVWVASGGGKNPEPPPDPGEPGTLPWVPVDESRNDGVWPDMVQREQGARVVSVQFALTVHQVPIPCDGDYGPMTSDHVRVWQVSHGLPNTGNVDWQTARSMGFNAQPVPAPQPDPAPTPPPASTNTWIEANPFFYLWSGARWSYTVAKQVWGDGNLYPYLDGINSPWPSAGQHVRIPQISERQPIFGAGAIVQSGDGPYAILRRIWPNDNPADRISQFYKWNGGPDRPLRPGESVFIPA